MGGMTRLLLLLLWVGVTVITAVDLQKRIIGGHTCKDVERQYHVKLVDTNNNLLCGGSLVSASWVLTAAHCWENGMIAVLGLHPVGGQEQREAIRSHKIFQKWKYIIWSKKHDIMLLKLQNPIRMIQPVPLPTAQDCQSHPNVHDMVQVAGYASTKMHKNHTRIPGESPTLQCVDLKIIDSTQTKSCMRNSTSRHVRNKAKEHWSLYQYAGRSTSPGDSGGGVVFNGQLYGVHVFSFNGTHACVAPAGFMDVCEYLTWINGIINLKPKKCLTCG